jgi:hypothetical protein
MQLPLNAIAVAVVVAIAIAINITVTVGLARVLFFAVCLNLHYLRGALATTLTYALPSPSLLMEAKTGTCVGAIELEVL